MEPHTQGTAEIRHRDTGVIYKIEPDELDWQQSGGEERGMGVELSYEAIVEHPYLGTLTWALWEYPLGFESCADTDVGQHEIVKNFDFNLIHVHERDDEDDYWLNVDIPDEPIDIFMKSHRRTGDLLAEHGGNGSDQILNRMIFSHQVTALEAYLGDTLIKATLADPVAMKRLIGDYTDLNKQKYTLAEVAAEPDLVKIKVRSHLGSILYHNIKKVNVLYKIALKFEILPLARDRGALIELVTLRHDCVHRNGFDKDGKELTVFTKEFVLGAADLIREFVVKIEEKTRNVEAERWLERPLDRG